MHRTSLKLRMRGTASLELNSQALARMPVLEFLDRVQAITGQSVPDQAKILRDMRTLGLPSNAPMCDLLGAALQPEANDLEPFIDQDLLMYRLLVVPFCQIHRAQQKERA